MMDKSSASELIYARALGCLDTQAKSDLIEYLKLGGELTWEELGELQNLVSLLPITLELDSPASTLKDKIARKIYNAIEEERARRNAELQQIEDELAKENEELPANYSTTIEQPSFRKDFSTPEEDDIKIEETDISSEIENVGEISITDDIELPVVDEAINFDLVEKAETEQFLKKSKEEFVEIGEKLRMEKIPLTKKKYEEIEEPKKKNVTGVILDVILYVLLLAAIAFVYVKLSGEIKDLKKEVDKLKKKNSSFINFDYQDYHFYA